MRGMFKDDNRLRGRDNSHPGLDHSTDWGQTGGGFGESKNMRGDAEDEMRAPARGGGNGGGKGMLSNPRKPPQAGSM